MKLIKYSSDVFFTYFKCWLQFIAILSKSFVLVTLKLELNNLQFKEKEDILFLICNLKLHYM